MTDIKDTLRELGVTWANEYGDYIKGAAEDVSAFYGQIASISAVAAIEGDEDALRMVRLAGYSMLTAHRCQLSRKNRATVQRGIRLLVNVVGTLALAVSGNVPAAVAGVVDRVIPQPE